MAEKAVKLVSNNKKAYHEYFIEETYEAGIELTGTEIKSVRSGGVSLSEAYAKVDDGEVWVYGMNIAPYEKGNRYNKEPLRPKRLLLHRQEIRKLIGYTTQKGLTLIPTKVYINQKGLAKLELAVARGKKLYDKRADIASRDAKRDIDRRIKDRGKDE